MHLAGTCSDLIQRTLNFKVGGGGVEGRRKEKKKKLSKEIWGISLAVQWLRIHFPMQKMHV